MRSFGVRLGVIAAVAFVVRAAVALAIVPDLDPAFDPALFHQLGTNLADGLGYVRPPQQNGGEVIGYTAEFAPALPALVALGTLLGARSAEVQGVALAVVGSGTVIATGLVARRVWSDAAGVGAAVIIALHPLLVQVDAVLTAESPYLLFVALSVLAAVASIERPTGTRFALLGALIGLAALSRAEGLALGLLVLVAARRADIATSGRRAAFVAIGVLAVATVVAPWTVRNAIRFGEFVPVSNNIGSVVLGANCSSAYRGDRLGSWDFGCIAAAAASSPELRIERGGPNEAEVYGRWRALGIRYARSHVSDVPRVMAARLARTWGVYWDPVDELDRNVVEGRHRGLQATGMVVHTALVLPAAVVGAVRVRRVRGGKGRRAAAVLAVPLVVAIVVPALTVGQTRQRTVAEPALAVLAAIALTGCGAKRTKRANAYSEGLKLSEVSAVCDERVTEAK